MNYLSSIGLAAAFSLAAGAASAQYVLNLSSAQNLQDPMGIGMKLAEERIEARTGGKVQVTVYPSAQLGEDNDILEQIRNGAPIGALVDAGRLAPLKAELGILAAPYLVDGPEGYAAILNSPVYQQWVDEMAAETGMRLMNYNWFQGTRQMFTKKLIEKPADLAGIRVRTIGAPSWVATVNAMGASATPLPWSEVYSALQMGAIDGAEAQLTGAFGIRLHEVSTNVALTGHVQLFTGFVTSEAWWKSLPEDLRVIVDEELKRAGDEATQMTIDRLAAVQKDMEAAGVKFNAVDTTPFREATLKVYEEVGLVEARKALEPYLGKN